ncbi:DUF4209 domain-containing protein [Mucilaginibacter gilvus]|uniref:DUF4209 domain-containing protein n=1 Tax=Mucilaginibacter gilvus TaxID=2305909 RepID=A0A444MUD0_9SPHI|nr:DUF4209 domain-containing protein [Mucilaginibacter gilvus]RWY57209.1 DUF4209 domain-containing protein [Mucilaginibacter gilvus]
MYSIQAILEPIDVLSCTRLDERGVAKHIDNFIQSCDGHVDETLHWEKAAFEFHPNYKNKETGWGTYHGPMYIWPNEKGQSMECPSIQMLSETILDYYHSRAVQAQNPILTARYYGLVYDFYHRITNKRTPYDIKTNYVKALVETANGAYYTSPIYVVEKLRRALEIALSISNRELINLTKDGIISFENKTAEDKFPGLWGYSFDLLVLQNRNKSILEDLEEQQIVQTMKDRLKRLLLCENDKSSSFRNSEFAATYLAKHFRSKSDHKSKIKHIEEITDRIESRMLDETSGSKAVAEYERLHKLCTEFGLNDRAKRYLIKIRELGRKAHDEMSVFRFEHSISNEKLEAFASIIFKGRPVDKILKIAHSFIPDLGAIEQYVKDDFKANPVRYIVTQRLMDRQGRTMAVIGPIETDLEGHIFYYAFRVLKINVAPYLSYVLHKAKTDMEFEKSDILKAFEGSPVVSPARLKIIEAGLDAYFDQNYLVAIHLLIPQIEEALRNTLEIHGGVILNYREDGSSYVKTLDSILRDEITVRVLGEHVTNYFRLLLTDQRGWNLRNDVCHGLSEPESFTNMATDRVIHAILCLTNIKTF